MSRERSVIAPVVRHRLIVRDAAGDRILVDERDGRWQLPALLFADRHTADADYINAAMLDRFGVHTVVLRSLSHSDPVHGVVERAHELELLGDATGRLQGVECAGVAFVDPVDLMALARWRQMPTDIRDGREWTRPGWFDAAGAWIGAALRDVGLGAPRRIRQLRTWQSSCVLAVDSGATTYYFKALSNSGRVEFDVTCLLAQCASDVVPRLLAVQRDRRWLLMEACAGTQLEEVVDVAAWERAAARYAALQVDCIGRVGDLAALGCPTRGLDALARSIDSLSTDADALRVGRPDGLTYAEAERFRGEVPALQRRCAELRDCGIPLTLEHGDLWPGNVFVDATACAIIDWEDAAVAPPFFSLAPLTVGMLQAGFGTPDHVQRVTSAYLRVFESVAPTDRLRRAAQLAAPLCFVEMAARYRNQRASIVLQHPWMRELVPQALRLALDALG